MFFSATRINDKNSGSQIIQDPLLVKAAVMFLNHQFIHSVLSDLLFDKNLCKGIPVAWIFSPRKAASGRNGSRQRDQTALEACRLSNFFKSHGFCCCMKTHHILQFFWSHTLSSSSFQRARIASSTSLTVLKCEKLNRTIPCSTVPKVSWVPGAQ